MFILSYYQNCFSFHFPFHPILFVSMRICIAIFSFSVLFLCMTKIAIESYFIVKKKTFTVCLMFRSSNSLGVGTRTNMKYSHFCAFISCFCVYEKIAIFQSSRRSFFFLPPKIFMSSFSSLPKSLFCNNFLRIAFICRE